MTETRSFLLYKGEFLTLDLITQYNETQALDDSACTYALEFESINCQSCGTNTYEEVIDEIDQRRETFETTTSIYTFVNQFVNLNFQLITIIAFIFKIFVIIGAITLLFYGIFWVYFMLRNFIRSTRGGS